jgi:hypothetical protein
VQGKTHCRTYDHADQNLPPMIYDCFHCGPTQTNMAGPPWPSCRQNDSWSIPSSANVKSDYAREVVFVPSGAGRIHANLKPAFRPHEGKAPGDMISGLGGAVNWVMPDEARTTLRRPIGGSGPAGWGHLRRRGGGLTPSRASNAGVGEGARDPQRYPALIASLSERRGIRDTPPSTATR